MRKMIIAVLMFAITSACGTDAGVPELRSDMFGEPLSPPRCGDGICDEDCGENEWWCSDCGYDPFLGGPADGGYCGDGVCFGLETMSTCFRDCGPESYKGQPPWDPGWIDPPPWGDEPAPPVPHGPRPPEPPLRADHGSSDDER
jgi:hypothetical protein